jgi:hypothetical protein
MNTPNRKCRVVIKGTHGDNFADFSIDHTFHLPGFVTNVRATGLFMNDEIYVPAAEIRCIFIYTEGSEGAVFRPVAPMPTAPGTDTKQ